MIACSLSSSESILAKLLVVLLLLFTSGHFGALKLGQLSAESAILLGSQVVGRVSLLFEFSSCGIDSLLAENSEDLGDVLSNLLYLGKLHLGLGRDFRHSQSSEFFLILPSKESQRHSHSRRGT